MATLADLECLVGLPDPEVRIVQIKLPKVLNLPNTSEGFLPKTKTGTDTNQDKALSPKFRAKIAAQDEGEIKNEIAKESQSLNQVPEGEQEDNIDWDSTRDKEDAIKSGKIKTQGKIRKREEGLEMVCDRLIEKFGQETAKNSRESSTENQKEGRTKPEPELVDILFPLKEEDSRGLPKG